MIRTVTPEKAQTRIVPAFSVPKSLDPDKRRFQAVANKTGEKDRHETVFQPGAFREMLDLYRQNPVVLWNHNMCDNKPPIAQAQDIEDTDSEGLLFWPTWQKAGIDPFADMIYAKYTSNPPLLRAFSVGFMPWAFDDSDPLRVGAEETFTKAEVQEISGCNIPSNRGSLARDAFGRVRLSPALIRAIEGFGFIQAARLATDPSGATQGAPITRAEVIETLEVMTVQAVELVKGEKTEKELAILQDAYRRLGAVIGDEFQQTHEALLDKAEQACETIHSLRGLNDQLVGSQLQWLVSAP